MAMRLVYLTFSQLIQWMILAGRKSAAKDVELLEVFRVCSLFSLTVRPSRFITGTPV